MCATFVCENCGRVGCVNHHRCGSIERAGCDLVAGDAIEHAQEVGVPYEPYRSSVRGCDLREPASRYEGTAPFPDPDLEP